jgi:hypothetical protein
MAARVTRGGCLCGGVRYEIDGPLRDIVACHCSQCRKTSGHFMAATSAPRAALRLTASETLRWYRSSDTAERGFCARCGGNLFWRRLPPHVETISIAAGTLDGPVTGLKIIEHIYVADKLDYYALDDGAPQRPAD